MLIIDFKDFRNFGCYTLPLEEAAFEAALVEAGVKFDSPMSLKVRIKDMDSRMVPARMDSNSEAGDDFRLNLYLPIWEADGCYLAALNKHVRHLFAHVSQIRDSVKNPEVELTAEDFAALEAKAEELASLNTVNVLPCVGPLQ